MAKTDSEKLEEIRDYVNNATKAFFGTENDRQKQDIAVVALGYVWAAVNN